LFNCQNSFPLCWGRTPCFPHTYDNWFYRRNNVYQDFGFNKFISKEFFNEPEYNGQYIRDTELSRRILEEIKKTDKPYFVYAVSMQAHGPYSLVEKPNNSTKISGNLSPDSKAILENYTQIVSDVDQSLKLLIEGLEQLSEPSLVVFFRDHLRLCFGTNFNVYKEANFFQDESDYQDLKNQIDILSILCYNKCKLIIFHVLDESMIRFQGFGFWGGKSIASQFDFLLLSFLQLNIALYRLILSRSGGTISGVNPSHAKVL